MLGQRRRRWPSIIPALVQCVVFAVVLSAALCQYVLRDPWKTIWHGLKWIYYLYMIYGLINVGLLRIMFNRMSPANSPCPDINPALIQCLVCLTGSCSALLIYVIPHLCRLRISLTLRSPNHVFNRL